MIAWSTVAACAGRWATSNTERRCADVAARARDDQLALARAQLARGRDERVERLVGDGDGAREVDDQPAHAAGERGVDAARELAERGRVERAAHVELVDDVVEPLLTDRERSRRDDGAQGLRGEHGDPGAYPFGQHSRVWLSLGSSARMRIWVDLTNSPHVLVMRPVIRALEGRGAQVHVTARDFAQTLGLLERFGDPARGDRAPPRRAAGGEGPRPGVALARARELGQGPPLRRRARPRLERRHGRREAARDPERDDVRLRVGDRPAHGQLPPRAARRRARRDPARAARALRRERRASCARTRA